MSYLKMTANSGISQRMNDPVTILPGVGKKRAETLARLDIETVEDLLRHYPKRYEDRRRALLISELKNGVAALTRVRVHRIIKAPGFVRGGGAKRIPMKVYCRDDSGELTLLFFNARWLSGAFNIGAEYWIYGIPRRDLAGVFMAHPEFDLITSGDEVKGDGNGAGIIPVYPLTEGISQKYLRSLIKLALPAAENAKENLPEKIIKERRLAPLSFALKNIHYPDDEHALNAARYRLVYEELFLLQYRLLKARAGADEDGGLLRDARNDADSGLVRDALNDIYGLFPFELTGAQKRSIEEIYSDMTGTVPMRRLLQGDVGSGKTAVASAVAFMAAKNGYQTAIMAPTEILAVQHYQELNKIFQNTSVNVGLLTSGLPPAQKREVKENITSGAAHIVIGTHALIEPDITFENLGLVVTDEQHRFGVRQRLALKEKGKAPDTLVMTATPIPRTLAMMLYADLDVSLLDEMPPGRKTVKTRYIDSSKRDAAYEFAEKEMASGRQVYVVAPMIGDEEEDLAGEDGDENETGLASAIELTEELKILFPHRSVTMLHGRMKSEQKEEIMRAFAAGDIDLLVSTVVIEVGISIPNAAVMIVENAERFGLAQLHQLRGRVGRGAAKSYCILISDSGTELARKRLETLAYEHDGFKIAELDLALRGPGDLFGVRQHGLPELKIADPVKHMDILMLANSDAKELIKNEGDSRRV